MCSTNPVGDRNAHPDVIRHARQAEDSLRRHFWETDSFLTCPIVGLCLTFDEQERVLKKAGISVKGKTPFDIHEILVASAESENLLSARVDRYLDRKYGPLAGEIYAMSEQTAMDHFRGCFRSGNYDAAYWAMATRLDLSAETRKAVFAMIHMSMHATAEEQIALKRQVNRMTHEHDGQSRRIQSLKQAHKDLAREGSALKSERDLLKVRLSTALAENGDLKAAAATLSDLRRFGELEAENHRLKADVAERTAQAESLAREVRHLKQTAASLTEELAHFKRINEELTIETREALRAVRAADRCDVGCPAFDLCRKRILIVGGITRMESLYRQLIEARGGIMEYHDGYVKGGTRKLEQRLKWADMVLCPVNCNSHAACSLVKNLGKKHNKPVHLLPNVSLTAVSQIIAPGEGESRPVSAAAPAAAADAC